MFVVRRLDGTLIGSSSYLNVDPPNRRPRYRQHLVFGIGAAQRREYGDQAAAMLGHAFDVLDCVAVEFLHDFFNSPSRTAIEGLGAKLDGILHSHQLVPPGTRRDTERTPFSMSNGLRCERNCNSGC